MAASEAVRIVDREEAAAALTLDVVMPVVRAAYVALHRGEATLFPIVREHLPSSLFGIRSAAWPDHGLLGLKVSGYYPGNLARGLDNHQSTVVLLDPATGCPRTFVDGNHVTWIRTAAAGAVGTVTLARPDARRIAVVGTGLQAHAQAVAHVWALADREPELVVASASDASAARATALVERLAAEHGIAATAAPSVEHAVGDADIVVTATPSTRPVVRSDWLRPGTHVSAIGSDSAGKRELDQTLLEDARVVVDDVSQSTRLGEAQYLPAARRGSLTSLGAVLAGDAPGRQSATELTVFDSTGLGVHDLAVAALLDDPNGP
jgi:ornithine cyclodeaminase